MMKHLSFCAGYGGLDLALEAAFDARTIAVSDINAGANKILAHRYTDVPNLGDMTMIDPNEWKHADLISGGTPCQDLSHAGRRAGMTEGTRSNLWVSMRETVAVIRPRLVVWENVRGAYSALASSDCEPCVRCGYGASTTSLRALGRVLGDLNDLGYNAHWYGLRASDIGAAHRRMRVFVFAYRRDINPLDLFADGPMNFPLRARSDRAVTSVFPTPTVNDMGEGKTLQWWDDWIAAMKAKHGNGNGHGKSLAIEAQRIGAYLPTPGAYAGARGGASDPAVRRAGGHAVELTDVIAYLDESVAWGEYRDAIIAQVESFGTLPPYPCEATSTGTKRLNPAFAEWLMGLPAGWITDVPGITRAEVLHAAGNGVVPQQAYAAAQMFRTDVARSNVAPSRHE